MSGLIMYLLGVGLCVCDARERKVRVLWIAALTWPLLVVVYLIMAVADSLRLGSSR